MMTEPSTPASSVAANLWSPFRQTEELSFKRTSNGWVDQAPNLWQVEPGRNYLVNDTRRRMWTLMALALVLLIAIGLPLWRSLIGDSHPIAMLGVFLLLGAFAGMMVGAYTIRRLRPVMG
jgi:hypothetical protein